MKWLWLVKMHLKLFPNKIERGILTEREAI